MYIIIIDYLYWSFLHFMIWRPCLGISAWIRWAKCTIHQINGFSFQCKDLIQLPVQPNLTLNCAARELNFNKSCTNQKSHISSNKGSKLNYQSKRCIYLAQTKVNDLEHNRGKNDFQKSKWYWICVISVLNILSHENFIEFEIHIEYMAVHLWK